MCINQYSFSDFVLLSVVFLNSPNRLWWIVIPPVILDCGHKSSGPHRVLNLRDEPRVPSLVIRLLVTYEEVWLIVFIGLRSQRPDTELGSIEVLLAARLEDLELHVHVLDHLIIEARVLSEALLVCIHDVEASVTELEVEKVIRTDNSLLVEEWLTDDAAVGPHALEHDWLSTLLDRYLELFVGVKLHLAVLWVILVWDPLVRADNVDQDGFYSSLEDEWCLTVIFVLLPELVHEVEEIRIVGLQFLYRLTYALNFVFYLTGFLPARFFFFNFILEQYHLWYELLELLLLGKLEDV